MSRLRGRFLEGEGSRRPPRQSEHRLFYRRLKRPHASPLAPINNSIPPVDSGRRNAKACLIWFYGLLRNTSWHNSILRSRSTSWEHLSRNSNTPHGTTLSRKHSTPMRRSTNSADPTPSRDSTVESCPFCTGAMIVVPVLSYSAACHSGFCSILSSRLLRIYIL